MLRSQERITAETSGVRFHEEHKTNYSIDVNFRMFK